MFGRSAGVNEVAKSTHACDRSCKPEKMLARLAQQIAVVTNAFSNTTPRRASESTLGVWMIVFPMQPSVFHRWSSARTNTKFGREACGAAADSSNDRRLITRGIVSCGRGGNGIHRLCGNIFA